MRAWRSYVASMSSPTLVTADELLRANLPDKRVELVRGVLVVREPPGYRHGEVTARLAKLLIDHADAHDLGRVLAGDSGFNWRRIRIPCGGPTLLSFGATECP